MIIYIYIYVYMYTNIYQQLCFLLLDLNPQTQQHQAKFATRQ